MGNGFEKMNENANVITLGNIYPSKGQNGDVFDISGLSPCLRSGQGIKGRGIGSCNAPKIIVRKNRVAKVAINASTDGTCRTLKANYWKVSCANFIHKDGLGATGIIEYEYD